MASRVPTLGVSNASEPSATRGTNGGSEAGAAAATSSGEPPAPPHLAAAPRPAPSAAIPRDPTPNSARDRLVLPAVLLYAALTSVGTGLTMNGVFFVTAEQFGFGDLANLLLGLAVNLPYIPAAMLAGPLSKRWGARLTLVATIVIMIAMGVVLAAMPPAWAWWLLVPAYNACAGLQWPIVESYVASGRHGTDMRRSIGLFNITWAAAVGPGLWLISLFHDDLGRAFVTLAIVHAVTLPTLACWPARPPAHDVELGRRHAGGEYPLLLRASRVLLPLSYVLINLITPLMPRIWDDLGVRSSMAPSLTSTWMVVRVPVFIAMYLWIGWHGRWGVLVLGGTLLTLGSTLAAGGWSTEAGVVGLALLGTGQAMVYYAALYYGMAVGHAEVESGGYHEAIIGIGYLAGPLLGLGGAVLFPGAAGSLVVIGGLTVCGAWLGGKSYRKARDRRGA